MGKCVQPVKVKTAGGSGGVLEKTWITFMVEKYNLDYIVERKSKPLSLSNIQHYVVETTCTYRMIEAFRRDPSAYIVDFYYTYMCFDFLLIFYFSRVL